MDNVWYTGDKQQENYEMPLPMATDVPLPWYLSTPKVPQPLHPLLSSRETGSDPSCGFFTQAKGFADKDLWLTELKDSSATIVQVTALPGNRILEIHEWRGIKSNMQPGIK